MASNKNRFRVLKQECGWIGVRELERGDGWLLKLNNGSNAPPRRRGELGRLFDKDETLVKVTLNFHRWLRNGD